MVRGVSLTTDMIPWKSACRLLTSICTGFVKIGRVQATEFRFPEVFVALVFFTLYTLPCYSGVGCHVRYSRARRALPSLLRQRNLKQGADEAVVLNLLPQRLLEKLQQV